MISQPARPGEFESIKKYFAPLSTGLAGACELTNDTASFSVSDGHEAVVTLDTMVSGVHFLEEVPPI